MARLIIEAGRAERHYWRDLWRYRELFYFLAWRDILVRYKQTVIGVLWAVIRPLVTMVIFTALFEKLSQLQHPDKAPYIIMVCVATLPWQFFSGALAEASNSLIGNANLISKVYFPRLIVPSASVITSFVDFLITFGLMAVLMAWKQFIPDWRVVLLPFFIIIAFGAAMGAGLWLCALNVKYRDFRFVVPFVVQIGLFVSPVGMSTTVVMDRLKEWPVLQIIYNLNPMVGVIDGFRWCLLHGQPELSIWDMGCSLLVTTLLISTGIWYFRRMEKSFADVI
jgi:lipopolysaccharide transport system permease protein